MKCQRDVKSFVILRTICECVYGYLIRTDMTREVGALKRRKELCGEVQE
jgi:hypothetical protein